VGHRSDKGQGRARPRRRTPYGRALRACSKRVSSTGNSGLLLVRARVVIVGIPRTWRRLVTGGNPPLGFRRGVRFPPPPLSNPLASQVFLLRGGLPPAGFVPVSFQFRSRSSGVAGARVAPTTATAGAPVGGSGCVRRSLSRAIAAAVCARRSWCRRRSIRSSRCSSPSSDRVRPVWIAASSLERTWYGTSGTAGWTSIGPISSPVDTQQGVGGGHSPPSPTPGT
jgi:hypothetical protein